jgi:single-stranded-DNA-specific exonuclease
MQAGETVVWKERRALDDQSLAPPMPMLPLIWKLLQARGLSTSDSIKDFLTPSLSNLSNPFDLLNMDKAVDRLELAYQKGETVCVYGDYDLDGSTGVALLYLGLKGLGFEHLTYYQPSRFTEGYGIHKDALTAIKQNGASVVVSVDCGITAISEAEYAKSIGLDLIITDHHLPRSSPNIILPDCVAVVNPNQGHCPSKLQHLSGVGVGFYLILALKNKMHRPEFDP